MTAKPPGHTIPSAQRVHPAPHRGTGLHVAGEINGRPATEWELEVRDRAYQQRREAELEQLTIARRQP